MTEIKGLPNIKGLGTAKTKALLQAGFKSVEDMQKASLEDIAAVEGIGLTLAERIKRAAQGLETKKKSVKIILSDIKGRLLRLRRRQKAKKPSFRRHDSHKKMRVGKSWRFPSGIHNKQRRGIAAKGPMVQAGYGSPKDIRGLHPSGYEEILVHNPNEVVDVDASTQAVRIGSTVGLKKRLDIEEKAEELGLKILNPSSDHNNVKRK